MESGSISQIFIYPIKSFDGVNVRERLVSKGGALKDDRRFGFVDDQGKLLSAKRFEGVHLIRSSFNSELNVVKLQFPNQKEQDFELRVGNSHLNHAVSDFFDCQFSLKENSEIGFPDDTEAYGPTLTTTASLEQLCQWFPEIEVNELIRRFRVNLILDHYEAFFEDSLCGVKGEFPSFKIGEVHFKGSNVCQRCPVPTRDSETGVVDNSFVKNFKENRELHLHPKSHLSQFNHFYRFCLNTQCIPKVNQSLKVGDLLSF